MYLPIRAESQTRLMYRLALLLCVYLQLCVWSYRRARVYVCVLIKVIKKGNNEGKMYYKDKQRNGRTDGRTNI